MYIYNVRVCVCVYVEHRSEIFAYEREGGCSLQHVHPRPT